MNTLKHILLIILFALGLGSCIQDGFETSPSAQPVYSTDSLKLGTQFADSPTPTFALKVYNPHSRQLLLSSVRMRAGEHFRLNVDGMSGREFHDVEIRPNDSIYVFVEATFPSAGQGAPDVQDFTDYLDVVTNGRTTSVVVTATASEVERLERRTLSENTVFTARRPYLIADTLRVAQGVTLTIEPGARLLSPAKAALVVEGTLLSRGTVEAPVTMRGDRTGNVVADISFEVMSNQWEGIRFTGTSQGNVLDHTDIANTCQGVAIDSLATLTMVNSRLTNSGTILITAGPKSTFTALGCELSNASDALLLASGGTFRLDRCTLANYYLFAYPTLAIVELTDPEATVADFTNCIIYGRGKPLSLSELDGMDIRFRRCLFKVKGEDDDNFLGCLWDEDPLLDFSLTEYAFPYTPLDDSPAIDAADASLSHPELPADDMRGTPRGATLGCYGYFSSK